MRINEEGAVAEEEEHDRPRRALGHDDDAYGALLGCVHHTLERRTKVGRAEELRVIAEDGEVEEDVRARFVNSLCSGNAVYVREPKRLLHVVHLRIIALRIVDARAHADCARDELAEWRKRWHGGCRRPSRRRGRGRAGGGVCPGLCAMPQRWRGFACAHLTSALAPGLHVEPRGNHRGGLGRAKEELGELCSTHLREAMQQADSEHNASVRARPSPCGRCGGLC
mmetsp:Transcript_8058/g.22213  ORF Transcript_8058/g.22213 Transcript_8058/m.22213 type:complete len:225 (-) Transcript_8058:1185-1859(-)